MRIKTLSLFSAVFTLTILLASSIGFADTEVRGWIAQDAKWTVDKSPYVATGSLIVQQGATLTIEPGVTVKFKPNTALQVDGTLVARGKKEMPITFTASQDKNPGGWGYILFSATSTPAELDGAGNYIKGCILEYSIIEYAGGIGGVGAAVMVNNAPNLLVDHSTIRNSASRGVHVYGKAVIRNSTISDNNGNGIYTVFGGDATITNNTITGNTASVGSGIFFLSWFVPITNNIITGNTAPQGAKNTCAIYIGNPPKQFKNNSIYNNKTDFDIYYGIRGGIMDATENCWGTTNEKEIEARVYDFVDDPDKGIVKFIPFLPLDGCSVVEPKKGKLPTTWGAIKRSY